MVSTMLEADLKIPSAGSSVPFKWITEMKFETENYIQRGLFIG